MSAILTSALQALDVSKAKVGMPSSVACFIDLVPQSCITNSSHDHGGSAPRSSHLEDESQCSLYIRFERLAIAIHLPKEDNEAAVRPKSGT